MPPCKSEVSMVTTQRAVSAPHVLPAITMDISRYLIKKDGGGGDSGYRGSRTGGVAYAESTGDTPLLNNGRRDTTDNHYEDDDDNYHHHHRDDARRLCNAPLTRDPHNCGSSLVVSSRQSDLNVRRVMMPSSLAPTNNRLYSDTPPGRGASPDDQIGTPSLFFLLDKHDSTLIDRATEALNHYKVNDLLDVANSLHLARVMSLKFNILDGKEQMALVVEENENLKSILKKIKDEYGNRQIPQFAHLIRVPNNEITNNGVITNNIGVMADNNGVIPNNNGVMANNGVIPNNGVMADNNGEEAVEIEGDQSSISSLLSHGDDSDSEVEMLYYQYDSVKSQNSVMKVSLKYCMSERYRLAAVVERLHANDRVYKMAEQLSCHRRHSTDKLYITMHTYIDKAAKHEGQMNNGVSSDNGATGGSVEEYLNRLSPDGASAYDYSAEENFIERIPGVQEIMQSIAGIDFQRAGLLSTIQVLDEQDCTNDNEQGNDLANAELGTEVDLESIVLLQELMDIKEERNFLKTENRKLKLKLNEKINMAASSVNLSDLEGKDVDISTFISAPKDSKSLGTNTQVMSKEKELREQVDLLTIALAKMTSNSDERHYSAQHYIIELKKTNSILVRTLQSERSYNRM